MCPMEITAESRAGTGSPTMLALFVLMPILVARCQIGRTFELMTALHPSLKGTVQMPAREQELIKK